MRLGLNLSQEQSLRLSAIQRLQFQKHTLRLRLSLIQELRGELYELNAQCPGCRRVLTAVETLAGFTTNTRDFTTCCPSCGERFQPKLIAFGNGSQIELPFFCDVQTLAQMRGMEMLRPEEFLRESPAVYRAAIFHYGSLRSAFAEISISYLFSELDGWKDRVVPFLGRLPDTTIACHSSVHVSTIRKLRKKLGVSRYTARKALGEEADE